MTLLTLIAIILFGFATYNLSTAFPCIMASSSDCTTRTSENFCTMVGSVFFMETH